jgi:hypothetical protein
MGLGQLAGEAVGAAEGDMAKVQAAADAISVAIKKVQPWLNSGTWQGPEATSWMGEWNSFYAAVLSCLNGLPAAEANVVSQVRVQMEKMVQQETRKPA